MIQYYLDLDKQVKSINDKHLEYSQVQKIYSTAFFISFSIRSPGKTWHLYVGRGGGYEGVWISDRSPPKELRRKDNYLEYFRRHITSCSFISLSLDKYDRIVKMSYQKFGKDNHFCFFWKARKLYFLHQYHESPDAPQKLLLSWKNKAFTPAEEVGELFEYFNEVGRNVEMGHEFENRSVKLIEDILEEELKLSNLQEKTSRPHFLQRKKENIEDDLRKSQQWQRLQNILDQSHPLENMYELKVADQKIKFEGELNNYERRNLIFQKIKKLKKGEEILSNRLSSVNDELSGITIKTPGALSTIPMIKPVWGEEKSSRPAALIQSKDEFRIMKSEKYQIGVGLNNVGNDQLRNKWANKDDYWFHLDGQKSAHVIVKLLKQSVLDAELINLAGSVVAQYSQFSDSWIPVIFTQVKNLKGVTGATGMVIYKKEKHLKCSRINIEDWFKD